MTMLLVRFYQLIIVFSFFGLICSCDSRREIIIPENDSFSESGVSKIKIENYVNRLFIDLIGRGPTDVEKTIEVDRLNENDLSLDSREDLINRLMTDTTFSLNEGSYHEAYCNNLYLLAKIRCVEGVTDAFIVTMNLSDLKNEAYQDSIAENWEKYYEKLNEIRRYELMLGSLEKLINGDLEYHEMYAFMIDNGIYDLLNMNAFNFIRASFDQLLFRLPIEEEYNQAFDMVEFGLPNQLLGEFGSSKVDYINILISSTAMKEGMIRWAFQVFLQREGSAAEVATLLEIYKTDESINPIITKIIVTDEYANFY